MFNKVYDISPIGRKYIQDEFEINKFTRINGNSLDGITNKRIPNVLQFISKNINNLFNTNQEIVNNILNIFVNVG